MPQSLPPLSPSMASYFGENIVVMCIRAGLYQTKNGLLVFLGSFRSRKSMTLAEISSSTVFERSNVSGPSSLPVWFLAVPSEDFIQRMGRGGGRQGRFFGSIAAGGVEACAGFRVNRARDWRDSGDGNLRAWRRDGLLGRSFVDVGKAHALHGVQVVKVAPEFLEPVGRRQSVGMITQMVLAELAGGVAEIQQELGEGRCAGPQVRNAAGQLRRDHARAQRMHSGEEGVASSSAALLGVVVHEDAAFVSKPVNVRRFPHHQAAMIAARLHPADVIAHDEQDIGFLVLRLTRSNHAHQRGYCGQDNQTVSYSCVCHFASWLFLVLVCRLMKMRKRAGQPIPC